MADKKVFQAHKFSIYKGRIHYLEWDKKGGDHSGSGVLLVDRNKKLIYLLNVYRDSIKKISIEAPRGKQRETL